ncbi:MAG: hypothetical protein E5V59_03390, partial [Mesorhizobium sp.]
MLQRKSSQRRCQGAWRWRHSTHTMNCYLSVLYRLLLPAVMSIARSRSLHNDTFLPRSVVIASSSLALLTIIKIFVLRVRLPRWRATACALGGSGMAGEFQVAGKNAAALFALKVHRGDGMALLAMNWRNGQPPRDFVGFAIEYRVPNGTRFFAVPNRIAFPGPDGAVNPNKLSSRLSPIQKFRWVHFPFNAEIPGDYTYMVTPVFMDDDGQLSYGEPQTADIELRRETYPGAINVAFTRGFVSSQAFVDRWERFGPISTLLPEDADDGLTFTPTHPKTEQALSWMGFEDQHAIYETLDEAIGDASAKVCVVAYDLSEKGFVDRLRQLGPRLKVIIDDDGKHGGAHSGETQSADILIASAGAANVKRQSMGKLQHNKMIVVDGNQVKKAIGGSTNFSWRGFYVQSNNAMIRCRCFARRSRISGPKPDSPPADRQAGATWGSPVWTSRRRFRHMRRPTRNSARSPTISTRRNRACCSRWRSCGRRRGQSA